MLGRMAGTRTPIAIGSLLLLLSTVLVFHAFDSHSHSASDTLRPFLITMAPVWALSIGAVRTLLRSRQ
jgi:hypothetical protein